MDIKKIQIEVNKVQESPFASKTDKQLLAYEMLSELHKQKNQGLQPLALAKYNDSENRKTKLNKQKVNEIREKYNPYVYGKKKTGNRIWSICNSNLQNSKREIVENF